MKVSVIIPVYNVQEYLQRCIDSVLKQTFKDFELILIDDGSKDNSYEIMKKNAELDKRIKVFRHENSGPAITRNKGIDLAKGKYIMFIDSDDYIDEDYIENYYKYASYDYDIVMGGYKKVDDNKTNFVRKLKNGDFSKYIVMGPVCKMYKSSFLKNNKIYFLDTKASEDIYFNELVYSFNPKIKIIDNIGYYYYYNSSSLSNTMHKGFNEDVDIIDLVERINYKNIDNKPLNEYFIIRYLIWYLLYSGKNVKPKAFVKEYQKFFEWLKKYIPDYRKNINVRRCPSGEIYKIHLLVKVFIMLDKFRLVKLFSKLYCKGGS